MSKIIPFRPSVEEMTVEQFWSLPERVLDVIENTVLFYGECRVWYELDVEGNEYHISNPCMNFFPEYLPDFKDFGKIVRGMMPNMYAHIARS